MAQRTVIIFKNTTIFPRNVFFDFIGETQYDDPQMQFPRPIPDEVIRLVCNVRVSSQHKYIANYFFSVSMHKEKSIITLCIKQK